MRCEVIAIGTELLLGQIHDTNSSWIGEQLALAGIDSLHQVKVGDNHERIVASIRLALSRSDAVIMCGGLGPTQDDITRAAIAEVMGVHLVRNDDIGNRIRRMFESRGRTMPENNLLQADVPEGATLIAQMPGTAPGLVCPVGEQVIYAVPGVPYEMKMMMDGTILPDLQRRAGVSTIIKSRVLKTWGQSESGLAETLNERIGELDTIGNPTLAFQASGIEGIKVRITAKTESEIAANQLLDEEEQGLRALLGKFIFATDEQTMESVILDLLRERAMTLAVAEITTGGMISTRLTAHDALGEIFLGGVIAASEQVRTNALGVAPNTLGTEQAAAELADAARTTFGATIGIAVTGFHDIPQAAHTSRGTTFLGLSINGDIHVEEVSLPGDRERVRQYAVISVLNALRLRLLGLE